MFTAGTRSYDGISGQGDEIISSDFDFDNDGDIDIAVLHKTAGVTITFYVNDGSGVFTADARNYDGISGQGDEIISGDFDNNGWLDFMVSTGQGGQPSNPNKNHVAHGVYALFEGHGGITTG